MMRRWMLGVGLALLVAVGTAQAQETDDTLIGPDRYPAGVNPLTGLEVEDAAVLSERSPLVVKISNFPPVVRPQSGLNAADMVWEVVVEGGVTRFAAIFWSTDVELVGPVRSARLADIPITRIYRALLVHSGSSIGTRQTMQRDPYVALRNLGGGECPPLCRVEAPPEVPFENTLFGSVADLYQQFEDMAMDTTVEPVRGMAFAEAVPGGGVALDRLDLAYRDLALAWLWDEADALWLRETDGAAHFDRLDGEQLHADNVVILEADHIDQPVVSEGYWGSMNYATLPDIVGSGRVYLLRDGQYFAGSWQRADDDSPLYFVDAAGEPLAFRPGKTFVNLVPRWYEGYALTFGLAFPPSANVTTGAILRSGPGSGYAQVDGAAAGERLTLIGRNNVGDWVQVRVPDADRALWISTALTDVSGAVVAALPISRSSYEG